MHIDKLFKEKLYNHEAQVPEGMWEKIVPITEEESGRAILWFWFAGILTLLLGGYGIYKMIGSNSPGPTDSNTLVSEVETTNQPEELLVENSLITESNTQKENISSLEPKVSISSPKRVQKTESSTTIAKERQTKEVISPLKNVGLNNSTTINNSNQSISNTVENISNAIGVPANLVITKSYINNDGSIIKQTNLTDESSIGGPIYDVILNSETKELNAGALLRIIEPLENIPLPAFKKLLKKKTINTIL